jgi:hypothetical protein
MKSQIIRILITFVLILLVGFFAQIDSTLAVTVQSNSIDTAKQAGEQVEKDMGVKQQFGKSKNGEHLIDKAREKGSQNLNELADEANSNPDIADSKKQFLDNLQGNSQSSS